MPLKSLHDIKTLSGKVDRIANSYMAYMQITCLEMEKARKGRERLSALQRVQSIDARLREIDAEKAALLRALSERGSDSASTAGTAERRPSVRRTGGVRFQY